MSVTRGKFLKSLGKSIPGLVLGSGVATAAHRLLGKIASASGAMEGPAVPAAVEPKAASAESPGFITCGSPDGNRVALTFDDGPTPGVTDRILDDLSQRRLHATFFMIGERIAAAPELAHRVLAEGHEIGNHTFTHPKLTTLSDAQVAEEIQKTQDLMAEILNHRAAWFRPPYGAFRPNQAALAERAGLRVVLWNVDPRDWSQPGELKIVGTVLEEVKPGAIILCHDVHPQTANGVGPILDGLFARGLAPVTLSGLLD